MLPHWTILLLSLAPLSLSRRPVEGRGHLLLPEVGGFKDTLRRRQEPSVPAPSINYGLAPSSTSRSTFAPDPSSISAASRNTTALQYAQYLDSITTDNCTIAGGGCTQFQLTLGDCVADDCICQNEYTLSAMICAQCLATREAIMVYNTYLNWCDKEGIADPTDTFGVSMEPSQVGELGMVTVTSTSTVSTTVSMTPSGGAPSASASLPADVVLIGGYQIESSPPQSSTSVGPLVGPSGPSSNVAVPSQSLSPSGGPLVVGAVEISASGSVSAGTASLVSSSAGESPSIPTSAGGPPMTHLDGVNLLQVPSSTQASGTSEASGQPSASGSQGSGLQGSLALNAAIAFFSGVTVTQCESECTVWKGLSNTCTQDQCICTATGMSSAASCSSCIGSGSNGETPPDLQVNYSAFIGNCSAEGAVLVPTSGGPTGFEIVAAATSDGSSTVPPTMSIPPHINAAEQQGIVTVTRNAADARLDPLSAVHGWTVLVMTVGMALGGLVVI